MHGRAGGRYHKHVSIFIGGAVVGSSALLGSALGGCRCRRVSGR